MNLGLFRRMRRALSLAVAFVFAAAAVLVCLPVPAAGGGHCASMVSTEQAQHHCEMPAAAMDCCDNGQQSPTLPASPQGAARADAGSLLVVLHAEVVPTDPGRTGPLGLRAAPLHGHRHVDLPTLNSAFLI